MNGNVLLIARALDFAARKHVNQRRKGLAQEPYINHLTEVAQLLAETTEGEDANLIVAGLLHDTIEDQGVTHDELVTVFNRDVADLVREVTDDKSLPKAQRKRLQVMHAAAISERAKLVKLADKISNLRDVADCPPPHWSLQRRQEYFDWGREVVDQLRGVHPALEALFDAIYARRPG